MVRYGFVRTKEEIKFLVLYAAGYLPFPVTFESFVDICTWCDDGFGFFELNEAFFEMVRTGHIREIKQDDKSDALYEITERGRETSSLFQKKLPFSVREAAEVSALRVVRKIRRDAAIHTKVVERAPGDFVVTLGMEDVFSVDMNVVSQAQASLLEHNFQKNAEKIYQVVLNALIKDYRAEEEEAAEWPLRQLALLFSLCIISNLLSALIGGRVPGNVIGMVLLFALLAVRAVKMPQIEHAADFFLDNMAFFFLPSVLGILDLYQDLRGELFKIAFICVATVFLTAAAAGYTVMLVQKWQHKKENRA